MIEQLNLGDTVVSAAASQREGCGFYSRPGTLLCTSIDRQIDVIQADGKVFVSLVLSNDSLV